MEELGELGGDLTLSSVSSTMISWVIVLLVLLVNDSFDPSAIFNDGFRFEKVQDRRNYRKVLILSPEESSWNLDWIMYLLPLSGVEV